MKPALTLASILLALPAAALAQTTYYEPPLSPGELSTCMERDRAVRDRQSLLEGERVDTDRVAEELAHEGAALAAELRALDPSDAGAAARYNARSAEHNRRVALHNHHVADLNARTALVNGDAQDVGASCGSRLYLLRDRDMILRDRGTIR
jgi:hypothetical protein